ncbi:MAG: Rieske 2Fe-2S domain-containing protein [Myxococcales bacterium]|nr:Rieske 2Fe-2S domain-containing protein [Myxococcales bacterium]
MPSDHPKYLALGASSGEPFLFIAVKRGASVDVFYNRCPHMNLPLATKETKPKYEDGKLTCVQHKAVFDIERGVCVQGVCNGKPLWRIDAQVRGDDVFVA